MSSAKTQAIRSDLLTRTGNILSIEFYVFVTLTVSDYVSYCKGSFTRCDFCECDYDLKQIVIWMSMTLFIWHNCKIAVILVCATSHTEWVLYLFCAIAMCDSNIHSKSHLHPITPCEQNTLNRTGNILKMQSHIAPCERALLLKLSVTIVLMLFYKQNGNDSVSLANPGTLPSPVQFFTQCMRKLAKIIGWHPQLWSLQPPPPRENPGSATDFEIAWKSQFVIQVK